MSTIDTLTLPGTEKDIAVKLLTESIPEESGQVIIHATVTCQANWEMVRIWKTTFLIDRDSNHESRLILADNISFAPNWTPIVKGQTLRFTLVFEALPKNCRSFDFAEIISEPGGFIIEGITRNQTDVYRVDLSNGDLM